MVAFRLNQFLIRNKSNLIKSLFIIIFLIINFEIYRYHSEKCLKPPKIDVVYTWVNGSDEKFQIIYQKYFNPNDNPDNYLQRFHQNDELKYSLRSLERYAPWINHVYLVTNGQIPSWLDLQSPHITLITHEQIFRNLTDLPTFSSPAIEPHLHRIPDLSEKFIYFNDDIFLNEPIYPDDFYTKSRGQLIYFGWLVPACAPKCTWLFVNDGNCDDVCNNPACQWDGGDCESAIQKTTMKNTIKTNLTIEKQLKLLKRPFDIGRIIREYNAERLLDIKKNSTKNAFNTTIAYDAYGASLQHTNRLLNKKFGFMARRVPAHAPILLQKSIINEMLDEFMNEFSQTTSHKLRQTNDLQFSLMYYYYLISKQRNLTINEIFVKYDVDHSGYWTYRELHTILLKFHENQAIYDLMNEEKLLMLIQNCSFQPVNFYQVKLSMDFIENCDNLRIELLKKFGKCDKWKYDFIKNYEKLVSFKMLTSNLIDSQNLLDDLRRFPKKFVCINDNLESKKFKDNELIRELLYDFFESQFPIISKYELPIGYKNLHKYMIDYQLYNIERMKYGIIMIIIMFIISASFLLKCFKRILMRLIHRLLH